MRLDYLRHWSLRHRPFLEAPFFYGTPQRDVISEIIRFAESGRRHLHLHGASGCGMTRLLDHIQTMQGLGDAAVEFVHKSPAMQASVNLDRALSEAVGHPDANSVLASNQRNGIRLLWIVEDVTEFQLDRIQAWSSSRPHITIITSQRDRNSRLKGERLTTKLHPITQDETLAYIGHALRHAASDPAIFSDAACDRLHQLSGGGLGNVTYLAETALWESFRRDRPCVSADMIDRAASRWNDFGDKQQAA